MADELGRLAWALPLVLVAAGALAWLLRHVVPGQPARTAPRLRLVDSQALGPGTRVHLLEADQCAFVVVESEDGMQHSMQWLHQPPARSRAAGADPWGPRGLGKWRA